MLKLTGLQLYRGASLSRDAIHFLSQLFYFTCRNSTGCVYLRFGSIEAAAGAQRAMHMRWFARRLILAVFMVTIFNFSWFSWLCLHVLAILYSSWMILKMRDTQLCCLFIFVIVFMLLLVCSNMLFHSLKEFILVCSRPVNMKQDFKLELEWWAQGRNLL